MFARDRAAGGPILEKFPVKSQAVDTFVAHQMRATKGFKHQTLSGEVIEVARARLKVTKQSGLVDGASNLVVITPCESPMACWSRPGFEPWRTCLWRLICLPPTPAQDLLFLKVRFNCEDTA